MDITEKKVFDSQADLGPTERLLSEMTAWCVDNKRVVVLNSGMILAENPASLDVQNCKQVMRRRSLTISKVQPATQKFIDLMLHSSGKSNQEFFTVTDQGEISASQELLYAMVKDAVENNISDVHIEVRKTVAHVRFRRHGLLYLYREWTSEMARSLVSVAFNTETDQVSGYFNPNEVQSAAMQLQINHLAVRLRISSVPEIDGFDAVMRILTVGDKKAATLEDLGYPKEHVYLIKKAIGEPNGAMIIAGATGSGKTTTLAACLSLPTIEKKIYTIEDPVEKRVDNASQIPCNTEKPEFGFAAMTRGLMRMDPNIIMIGETRDADTAKVLATASITGHFVLSTLHANSTVNIVARLKELGLSSGMIADPNFLVCLIFQQLIPKLCTHCSVPLLKAKEYKPYLADWKSFFEKDFKTMRVRSRDAKCEHCDNLGITGRQVAAEVLWVDNHIRRFIVDQDLLSITNYLEKQGWRSARDYAMDAVKQGICDPLDAEDVVGKFNPLLAQDKFDYMTLIKKMNDGELLE